MWRNRKGFSLIEAIITIALLGVLIGSTVTMIGHIRYANTKKAVEELDNTLSSLRLDTMSRGEGRQYLYIYLVSDGSSNDGYYIRLLDENGFSGESIDSEDALRSHFTTSAGTRLCGTDATISYRKKGGTASVPVDSSHYICIAYKKNGVFLNEEDAGSGNEWKSTNADSIEFSGSGSYTITLNKNTGRHTVE